ncbi:hypothetical protein [Elizabethkingia meningoseptica]|uniref:hypothetical protein n=1 Tax=Elizabethkingia meningoseptica TaxID=238 RepID=UPI003891BF5D
MPENYNDWYFSSDDRINSRKGWRGRLNKIRQLRKARFGLIQVPEKLVVRKNGILYFFILFATIIIAFLFFSMGDADERYKMTIRIFVIIIFIFGAVVKLILGYIFPELVLSNNGIKIFGRKLIEWDKIEKIKVKESSGYIRFIVIKKNNKKIVENFKNLNMRRRKLKQITRSFLKKNQKSYF